MINRVNFRPAIYKDDVERIIELIKEFQAEGPDEYGLYCDDKVARKVLAQYEGSAFVAVREGSIVGVLAGIVTSYPLNDEKVFQEALWLVKKAYRGRGWGIHLLRRAERWCKENGIKKIIMAHTGNVMPEKFKRFYENLGYKMLEIHYLKQL